MNVILLGAPGAGKGTQAVLISQRVGLAHIASGDLFRQEQASGSELGKIAKSYMEKGQLVPDDVTVKMILGRIAAPDCAKPPHAATAISDNMEIYVDGVIDVQAERNRLVKQKTEINDALSRSQAKLSNEKFVNRAKPHVVQRERDRLQQLSEQLDTVQKNLDDLN